MYNKLFNINVLHNFYKNGICKNLSILPTADCIKIIRNHKLLLKQSVNGICILYKAIDDYGTPLIDATGQLFTFIITIKEPNEVLNITNLNVNTQVFTSKNIIHFVNEPIGNKYITNKLIDYLKPNIFNYKFPFMAEDQSKDLAKLEILDMGDNTILGPFLSIPPEKDGYYYKKIELSKSSNKKYKIRVSDSNNAQRDEVVYIDNELSNQSIFGIIEISYDSNALDEYNINLIRQESFWKYFIVNKSGSIDLDAFSLNVENTGNKNPLPYENNYEFIKGAEPDPDIQVNGYETVIFTSKNKIPFYEDTLLNIELLKKDKSGDPEAEGISLIKHLPNPKLSGIINKNNESEIYVFL